MYKINEYIDKQPKSVFQLLFEISMVLVIDDNKGAVWTETDNLIKVCSAENIYLFNILLQLWCDVYHNYGK